MAFPCVLRNLFSILPLLVLLSNTPLSSSFSPSEKVTKALVDQLCSKPSIYKHFCVSWLNSDPKTFTLDLHGLLGMVIQKTELFGNKNLEMIKGLASTTTDPHLKNFYGSCVSEYEVSIKAIEEAKGLASSRKYMAASDAAFRAFNSISTCEAQLEGQTMPAYVSPRNLMFERMCNIDNIFAAFVK